jgi:hypothetical protein
MERIAFLVVHSGERISCLLNPESLVVRRRAGLAPRRSIGGMLTISGGHDDPLLYTGGGSTELELDLLFDVSLLGSSIVSEDVRELTAPIWNLCENRMVQDGWGRPPLVRLVWGKNWNIPGVVAAVAERFEYFTEGGLPRRSWMRLRFLRVSENNPSESSASQAYPGSFEIPSPIPEISLDQIQRHSVGGTQESETQERQASIDRLYNIALHYYEEMPQSLGASLWRWLAYFNDLEDPLHIPSGQVLMIPPLWPLENEQ